MTKYSFCTKKYFPKWLLLLVILYVSNSFFCVAQETTMLIHLKNGETIPFSCDDVDNVDFNISSFPFVKPRVGHILSCNNNFEGKSACWFGNSITSGFYYEDKQLLRNQEYSYSYLFSEDVGLISTFMSVAGSCFGEPEGYSIYKKVCESSGKYDFIFVAGGTNDYALQTPLGNIDDEDISTYYGALNLTAEELLSKHGNSKIFFITPINQCRNAYFSEIPKAISLTAYRNAIYDIAEKFGFDVIDGSVMPFPNEDGNEEMRELLIGDGLHPTLLGHRLYAKTLSIILNNL